MHEWGDDWFKKYGTEFNRAITVLEKRIRKWAHAGVCGKEKWGCYRDEYLTLWNGGLRYLLTPYRGWVIGHSKWATFLWYIDTHLLPIKKIKYGWYWVGIADLNRVLGLTKLYHKFQERRINKAFQVTCKEYPHFIDELISDVDCYKLIKPCKWGDIDGEAIHKKYWKVVSASDYIDEMNKDTEKFV